MENGNEPDEPRGMILVRAFAEYFECEPEDIGVWIACCERRDAEGNSMSSSVWSSVAHWILLGLCEELKVHLERLRTQAELTGLREMGE